MEYAVFCILLLVSAFFSGSETALFSIGKVAFARLQQSERRVDRMIADLLASPRDLLITVLLGNELTNIALSITSASITSRFLHGYSLVTQAALSAATVVPLLLVFGEVTPKTFAAQRAEGLARAVARPLRLFAALTRPLRWGLRRLTDAAVHAMAGGGGGEAHVSGPIDESEFRTLVDVGAQEGVVEEGERNLIHNVLDFGDLTVADVMRHWEQVFSLSDATPVAEAITRVAEHQRSRVPICRGETRQVVGVLFTKDLLAVRWGVRPAPPRLKPLTRAPVFTLARRPAADLLEEFRARRTHLAIVVDEFGQAIGLCTMEDLLEELFGPITDDEAEARAEEAEESAEAARVEEESAAAAEAAAAEEAQPTRSEGEDA